MTVAMQGGAAIACALASAGAAAATTTLRQSVDLTELGLSIEGGEARLYRVERRGVRHCRIEAIHYGESGKATLFFDFGAKLLAAERRDYGYASPLSVNPAVKVRLVSMLTLNSRAGRKELEADLVEYKSYFPTREIAQCSRL